MNDSLICSGLNVHLFVDYRRRGGNLKKDGLPIHVFTILGRPYAARVENETMEVPCYFATAPRAYKYLNDMVKSLVDSCDMSHIKISVNVCSKTGPVTVCETTDMEVLLKGCVNEETFRWKDTGKIIMGGEEGIDSILDCKKLREHILKLKSEDTDRKHLVLFVAELFPCTTNHDEKNFREFFSEWKIDGVEFVTLRLNNPCIDYDYKSNVPMNYKLYQKLSTVPEWTQEGDYNKICFLLSLIGKKISSMEVSKLSEGLGSLVKNNPNYLIWKEVETYDQRVREKEEKEKRQREKSYAEWKRNREHEKKKDPFAYISILAAMIGIVLRVNSTNISLSLLFIFISLAAISLVSGFIGKESSRRGLSIAGIVLGIINVYMVLDLIFLSLR